MIMEQNLISKIKNVTSKECFKYLSKIPNAYLVDVRTAPEWLYIGLPNLESLQKKTICIAWQVYPTMEINFNFRSEIINAGINIEDSIFLICRSGKRSLDAAEFLTSCGFINCYNVSDGFEGKINHNNQRSNKEGWKFNNLPWQQC